MSVALGDTKRMICDGCTLRLRDALCFREQVENSLKILEKAAWETELKAETQAEILKEIDRISDDYNYYDESCDADLKTEAVNKDISDDELDSKNTDHLQPAIKMESVNANRQFSARGTRKTKSQSETYKSTKKKKGKMDLLTKIYNDKDIETFLGSGLFPFKGYKKTQYGCALCGHKFKEIDRLREHFFEHKKVFILRSVKKMIRSPTMTQFYIEASKFVCRLCSVDIQNFDQLKQHLESCTREVCEMGKWREKLPFKLEKDQLDCPVCQKKFLNYVSLNTHMNVHYPNYICESCGKAFASKPRLRGHMRIHEVGVFPCKYCSMVFDKVTKRENHVSKNHKSGVRYSCRRCAISLTSFYARQKHLAEVHNEELKRYKCKACPQSYITPGHLSSHVRRDHLNERNHQCDKCDLSFYTRNSLKMHMIKHDGQRIFTCEICQKAYQRNKTLKEHMRIHNNDKRFACPVCGRAFTQKCTLKSHLKVHDRKTENDVETQCARPLSSIKEVILGCP